MTGRPLAVAERLSDFSLVAGIAYLGYHAFAAVAAVMR
jgi:hypothetical protein